MPGTIDDIRRAAATYSLFPETTLQRALDTLGFVQADPIRAPARAQDLTLRQRVRRYRAGDLERRYAELDVSEDVFVNYGFVSSAVQRLMHPRRSAAASGAPRAKREKALLDFVRARQAVHPREVDDYFAHGTVTNYWGGSSNATTHMLDTLHYRGLLRVVRRDAGIRVYAAHEHAPAARDAAARRLHLDALVDVIVRNYAPLPAASLSSLVRRLRYAVPQWTGDLTRTIERARKRLSHAQVGGIDWYWAGDLPAAPPDDRVRLLAPFDPIVWDRRRFELLWGWRYRFEAYTPASQRKLGYYALPLLWRDHVIGWANLAMKDGVLDAAFGYASGRPPRDRTFTRELEAEVERVRAFLGRRAPTGARPR